MTAALIVHATCSSSSSGCLFGVVGLSTPCRSLRPLPPVTNTSNTTTSSSTVPTVVVTRTAETFQEHRCLEPTPTTATLVLPPPAAGGDHSGPDDASWMQAIEQLKQRLSSCFQEGSAGNAKLEGPAGEALALEVISSLEEASITKETLEATRIGLLVNDFRRHVQETHPALSKRCRALIKRWQQLVRISSRPPSSAGSSSAVTPRTPYSANVTPAALSAISPAVRNRLTPLHAGKPPTKTSPSTTSPNAILRKSVTAPGEISAVGGWSTQSSSYAPPPSATVVSPGAKKGRQLLSPNCAAEQHPAVSSCSSSPSNDGGGIKLRIRFGQGSLSPMVHTVSPAQPATVASNSSKLSPSDIANNRLKRKADDLPQSSDATNTTTGITVVATDNTTVQPLSCNGGAISPAEPLKKKRKVVDTPPLLPHIKPGSSERPKLKSTSELVAEMNLPEAMRMRIEEAQPSPTVDIVSPVAGIGGGDDTTDGERSSSKKKSKRREKKEHRKEDKRRKKALKYNLVADRTLQTPPAQEESKVALVNKFLDSSLPPECCVEPTSSGLSSGRDWYGNLPPIDPNISWEFHFDSPPSSPSGSDPTRLIDSTRLPVSQFVADSDSDAMTPLTTWRSRFVRPVRGREVLGMPYVDLGMPDFYEYRYSNADRFMSPLNWQFRPPTQSQPD